MCYRYIPIGLLYFCEVWKKWKSGFVGHVNVSLLRDFSKNLVMEVAKYSVIKSVKGKQCCNPQLQDWPKGKM